MDTAIAIATLTLLPFLTTLLLLLLAGAAIMAAIWVVFLAGRAFFSLFRSWL